MKFKKILTYSKHERKVRLFRVIWERGVVGDGSGYSAMFSLSLTPKLLGIKRRSQDDIRLVIAGINFHYKRSYGGRFV